jgi:predicted DNA binding protein
MKTIKMIADELGISKQKVYRYIKRQNISEAHHEAHHDAHHDAGVMYYDDAVEKQIKSHFKEISKPSEAHQSTSRDAVVDALVIMFEREIEVKNKQIEDLSSALVAAQQMAAAAQALHAGTIKTQLLAEDVKGVRGWLMKRWLGY